MSEDEFRVLYGRYRDPLFRFAFRLTSSAEVAEDLVHDCFVGLFRGGYEESRSSMRTYLYAAVRNLSRKHIRDHGRDDLEDLNDERGLLTADSHDPLGALVSKETAEGVRLAVESLPLLQREVLVLFEYEDLPLEEIAGIVDAEVGAVKSRLYRARERLRKCLMPVMKESSI